MSDPDITSQKRAMRAKLRHRRAHFVRGLPDILHDILFKTAPTPLAELLEKQPTIAAYVPVNAEPDLLRSLLKHVAQERGIALPWFSNRNAAMAFRLWRAGDPLERGPYGIEQPSVDALLVQPDLSLLPLVGFDRRFNRLGQGGGHYDRYLAQHPTAYKVGVAWSVQEVDAIPTEATDVPLDAILTQNEWITPDGR